MCEDLARGGHERHAISTTKTVRPGPLIYREEVTAILGVLADINVRLRRIYENAPSGRRTTIAFSACWKRLAQEGVTKEEALSRLRPNG